MTSAPIVMAWLGSTLLALAVLSARYLDMAYGIPLIGPDIHANMFEGLVAAYGLLWLATVFSRA